MTVEPCYVFDIDGTLADLSHRLHHIQKAPKDCDAFFAACGNDAPIPHMQTLTLDIIERGVEIIFVTGRNESTRSDTEAWLRINVCPGVLYMRKDGDHRDDTIVKSELLDHAIADGYAPIMIFEDRKRVVDMWRARGIPCAQVAEGDF